MTISEPLLEKPVAEPSSAVNAIQFDRQQPFSEITSRRCDTDAGEDDTATELDDSQTGVGVQSAFPDRITRHSPTQGVREPSGDA